MVYWLRKGILRFWVVSRMTCYLIAIALHVTLKASEGHLFGIFFDESKKNPPPKKISGLHVPSKIT